MQAGAAVVARCRDDKYVLSSHSRKARCSVASAWPFGDRSPPLTLMTWAPSCTLVDGPGQIKLWEVTLPQVPEYGKNQAAALRRDPKHGLPGWPKMGWQRGYRGATSPLADRIPHQRVASPDVGTSKAGMGQIHRAIQHRHASPGIAEHRTLRRPETSEHCPRIQRSSPPHPLKT